jgi:hypothetical protein
MGQCEVNFDAQKSIREIGNRVEGLTRLVRLKKRAMQNIEQKIRGWGSSGTEPALNGVQRAYLENNEELQAYRENLEQPNVKTLKRLKSLSKRQGSTRKASNIKLSKTGKKCQMMVPPHPPTMLRVEEEMTTENSITLSWQDPIFTASADILDFEVQVSLVHKTITGHQVSRTYEALPLKGTSRWCIKNPVVSGGTTLKNLTAATEYAYISVMAVTEFGKSKPSNVIAMAETKPAVQPSKPLFFEVSRLTASEICLAWMPPARDGGRKIAEYIVSYNVPEVRTVTGKGYGGSFAVEDIPQRIQTRVPSTSTVLSGLNGGVSISNVQVSAVNEARLSGEPAKIDEIATATPTRQQLLWDELDRVHRYQCGVTDANKAKSGALTTKSAKPIKFIDSDVLHGSFSRFGCAEFRSLVKKELRALFVEELERCLHFSKKQYVSFLGVTMFVGGLPSFSNSYDHAYPNHSRLPLPPPHRYVYSQLFHITPYRWNRNDLMLKIKEGIAKLGQFDKPLDQRRSVPGLKKAPTKARVRNIPIFFFESGTSQEQNKLPSTHP